MAVTQESVCFPPQALKRGNPQNYKTMSQDPSSRSGTPSSRTSFASIREKDSDLAQTFSYSKLSSLLASANEEAVEDYSTGSPTEPAMVETRFFPPVTRPESKLQGYWSPADSFRGWKSIDVKGKLASKSFGDLQVLNTSWNRSANYGKVPSSKGTYPPGQSPFEKLPIELLSDIINRLVLDVPPRLDALLHESRRNLDLMSLLLTSKTLHMATLSTLYSKITIPHSRIFHKFLTHVSDHAALGTMVRRLDFCHFNPSQLFSTAAERLSTQYLTSETLVKCLNLTPNLQEFLAQEYIDEDLDANVLKKLFFDLPRLQALDFCGCTSTPFKNAFSSILPLEWPAELSITRMSFHKCLTLPAQSFEIILPRLKYLTHLDVAGCRVTDKALMSIPHTARITHLNLAKCTLLTPEVVIDFLSNHPAVRNLVFLSLGTDARSHQLLDVDNVTEVIKALPDTLRSLSLKGSKMAAFHISLLRPLTKHLEELAIGRGLTLDDVNRLFVPDESEDVEEQVSWIPHTLKYLDLSDMWCGELDLSFLFTPQCALLQPFSEPLDVVEVPDDAFKRIIKSTASMKRHGWTTSERGARTWMVREHSHNCARGWKMGAEAWGMRKIPVARAEVGGMYGNFMFARKL